MTATPHPASLASVSRGTPQSIWGHPGYWAALSARGAHALSKEIGSALESSERAVSPGSSWLAELWDATPVASLLDLPEADGLSWDSGLAALFDLKYTLRRADKPSEKAAADWLKEAVNTYRLDSTKAFWQFLEGLDRETSRDFPQRKESTRFVEITVTGGPARTGPAIPFLFGGVPHSASWLNDADAGFTSRQLRYLWEDVLAGASERAAPLAVEEVLRRLRARLADEVSRRLGRRSAVAATSTRSDRARTRVLFFEMRTGNPPPGCVPLQIAIGQVASQRNSQIGGTGDGSVLRQTDGAGVSHRPSEWGA